MSRVCVLLLLLAVVVPLSRCTPLFRSDVSSPDRRIRSSDQAICVKMSNITEYVFFNSLTTYRSRSANRSEIECVVDCPPHMESLLWIRCTKPNPHFNGHWSCTPQWDAETEVRDVFTSLRAWSRNKLASSLNIFADSVDCEGCESDHDEYKARGSCVLKITTRAPPLASLVWTAEPPQLAFAMHAEAHFAAALAIAALPDVAAPMSVPPINRNRNVNVTAAPVSVPALATTAMFADIALQDNATNRSLTLSSVVNVSTLYGLNFSVSASLTDTASRTASRTASLSPPASDSDRDEPTASLSAPVPPPTTPTPPSRTTTLFVKPQEGVVAPPATVATPSSGDPTAVLPQPSPLATIMKQARKVNETTVAPHRGEALSNEQATTEDKDEPATVEHSDLSSS